MTSIIGDITNITEKEFNLFKDLIYRNTGIFLRDTKLQMLNSRLLRRLRVLNLKNYNEYYNYLTTIDDGSELIEMINCVTTNKTDFFRENYHFEYLKNVVLPKLKDKCFENGDLNIRVWSAACSTGEEPYSIGMTLQEYFENHTGWRLEILASDIDTKVLKTAEEGIYIEKQVEPIPVDLLKKYFYKGENQNEGLYKVKEKLKKMITFKKINLIDSSYSIGTPVDIIFCRNVFIYFDQETISRILMRFYSYLKPGGYLFLGHSEAIDLTEELKGKMKLVSHTTFEKL